MEQPEEFVASNDSIMKRKRTKRYRPESPYGAVATNSRSSSTSTGGNFAGAGGGEYGSISSTTTSGEVSTEEEEDMANCLILLAQGNGIKEVKENCRRRFKDLTPVSGKTDFYVYECKTCNRSFPSFQALGGHRASHKRPKITPEEKKVQIFRANDDFEERVALFNKNNSVFSLQIATNKNSPSPASLNKAKIHECSICGSEFSSGQALGGHMRRHRASPAATTTQITMELNSNRNDKPRNILSLDLNLPAPEDDRQDSKFPFLFSGPALVDCYY